MTIELDDVNSVEQVAAYLKLSERKVAELARTRRLAAIREGRIWIFPRAAVLDYIEKHTRAAVPPIAPAVPVRRGRTFP